MTKCCHNCIDRHISADICVEKGCDIAKYSRWEPSYSIIDKAFYQAVRSLLKGELGKEPTPLKIRRRMKEYIEMAVKKDA